MKDGDKVVAGTGRLYYFELVRRGWWAFGLPDEVLTEVTSWINAGEADDFVYGSRGYHGVFAMSVRRHEDAVLFKLSFPEAIPLMLD